MSDDLLDLSSEPLFTCLPNWASTPKYSFTALRRLVAYAGTADNIQSLGNVPAFACDAIFLLCDRSSKNEFLDFMHARAGRVERFWFRHPASFFTLKNNANIGATTIYVERQQFDWIWQGYERIYISRSNGDVITRKLTNVVDNEPLDRLELTFSGALDRTINVTDKDTIGRLLLCRFDTEEFQFKLVHQTISEVTIRVVELIQEYSELS